VATGSRSSSPRSAGDVSLASGTGVDAASVTTRHSIGRPMIVRPSRSLPENVL
jgi:hypothetical protein